MHYQSYTLIIIVGKQKGYYKSERGTRVTKHLLHRDHFRLPKYSTILHAWPGCLLDGGLVFMQIENISLYFIVSNT